MCDFSDLEKLRVRAVQVSGMWRGEERPANHQVAYYSGHVCTGGHVDILETQKHSNA